MPGVFESLKATVLQDGHVDHTTGPRCIVRMDEGPDFGKYRVAHTREVLLKDTPVALDWRGHATVKE